MRLALLASAAVQAACAAGRGGGQHAARSSLHYLRAHLVWPQRQDDASFSSAAATRDVQQLITPHP